MGCMSGCETAKLYFPNMIVAGLTVILKAFPSFAGEAWPCLLYA